MMDWWEKAVLPPVKRAWVAVAAAARPKPDRKIGTGIEKLEDDVQTCEYEDVQVMWEMLRTEMEISSQRPKRRRAPLAKAFVWFDRPATPPRRRHRLTEVHAQSPAVDGRRSARFAGAALCVDRCLPK